MLDRPVSGPAPGGVAQGVPAPATGRWQTEDWIAVLLRLRRHRAGRRRRPV